MLFFSKESICPGRELVADKQTKRKQSEHRLPFGRYDKLPHCYDWDSLVLVWLIFLAFYSSLLYVVLLLETRNETGRGGGDLFRRRGS